MVIVEGLDNTGKTTLVEKIVERFPELEVIPSIGNKHDLDLIATQAKDGVVRDIILKERLTLWDRSRFISEYVYVPVLRNRPFAIDSHLWLSLVAEYLREPQLIIWCSRPVPSLLEDWDDDAQLSGVYDNIHDLAKAYNKVMGFFEHMFYAVGNGSRLVKYNFDFDEPYMVYDAVSEYVRRVS